MSPLFSSLNYTFCSPIPVTLSTSLVFLRFPGALRYLLPSLISRLPFQPTTLHLVALTSALVLIVAWRLGK